ncbi:MAG: Tll0287-like domain-containing protein [Myxococcota bacterium]
MSLARTSLLMPAILVGLTLGACKEESSPPAAGEVSEDQVATRAAEALKPFKKNLKQALMAGLEEGPGEAIDVCRVKAPDLAAEASGEGIAIGRTSHKLRNPDNAPEDWMKPLLEEFREADEPAQAAHRVVRLGDERWGYVEPIRVKGMCLTCHGTDLPEPVEQRLAAQYPEDQATGFEEGDFRGLFWVELEPEAFGR